MQQTVYGVTVMVLALVPLSAHAQSKTQEERQAETEERMLQRQDIDVLRGHARRRRAEFVAKAERALAQLTGLSDELESHNRRVKQLLTNAHGQRIAQDPIALMTFLRVHDEPVASIKEVYAQRASASSLVDTFNSDIQRLDVGYLPSAELEKKVDTLLNWVDNRLQRLRRQVSTVNDLLDEAKNRTVSDSAKTLQQTMDDFRAMWPQLLAESGIIGREMAKPQAEKILVDSARLVMLERAEVERKRTIDENRAAMERMRMEYELQIAQMHREMQAIRARDAIAAADAKAGLERAKKLAAANRLAETVEVDVKANQTVADAEHRRKLAAAQSPEVQALLKPFIAKAYYQPGNKTGYDKTGVSLSAMRSRGALERSGKGLAKLHAIATDRRDHERPRLGMARRWRFVTPQQRDELKRIQAQLIDLCEALVELGYLAP